jgi:hypothetical protein
MAVKKVVHRDNTIWIIDETRDGQFSLLELQTGHDFTLDFPPGGTWYPTLADAEVELQLRVRRIESATRR